MHWKYMIVPLSRPIKLGENNVIEQFKLREPNVQALELIHDLNIEEGKEPTIKQLRGMIVALSDQPEDIIAQLHPADALTLSEAIKQLRQASAT